MCVYVHVVSGLCHWSAEFKLEPPKREDAKRKDDKVYILQGYTYSAFMRYMFMIGIKPGSSALIGCLATQELNVWARA